LIRLQEVLCVGDEVDVKVTSLEPKKGRVGFSIRQMTDDPLLETLDTLMAPEVHLNVLNWKWKRALSTRLAVFVLPRLY
jgi:ribosomal protein S1